MSVAHDALGALLRLAGMPAPAAPVIAEAAPAINAALRVEEAASAALAAGALAAAELHALRGGARQDVRVHTREAGASLVSFLHQRFEEPEKAPGPDLRAAQQAAFGFHRARDGRFVYLHPSFPPSTEKLLALLGCEAEHAAVAAAVAGWEAQALEDAIAEAGVCGARCRTADEWAASEQGRILAGQPVVEIVKIGESAPEPFEAGERPLSGVRVLDLTRVLAGPACARALAQYGAEAMVITAPDLPSVPLFVSDTGHGKLSAHADLKTEAGRAAFIDLVRGSDVVSNGYRQGALERLGFGPLDLARLRPGLICVAINCYGHEGGWRGRPGWEQLAQTVTGMAATHGGAESPELVPAAACDYTTGYLAAFGVLVALARRARFGGAYLVRASLCQTAMWISALGADPGRRAAHAPLTPEELAAWSVTSETGFGRMRHLRPPVSLSHTPAHWARGTAPLGSHPPVWPSA